MPKISNRSILAPGRQLPNMKSFIIAALFASAVIGLPSATANPLDIFCSMPAVQKVVAGLPDTEDCELPCDEDYVNCIFAAFNLTGLNDAQALGATLGMAIGDSVDAICGKAEAIEETLDEIGDACGAADRGYGYGDCPEECLYGRGYGYRR